MGRQLLIQINKQTGEEKIIKKGFGPGIAGARIGLTLRGDPNLHYYVISKKAYRARQASTSKPTTNESSATQN